MAKRLTDDPRYPNFAPRYAFDVVRFAVEVVGMVPTQQQIELMDSVGPPGSRTSVRSGHGIGKSRVLAVIAIWHLLCYYKSNTLITAPKIEQVKNVAWKEIADVLEMIRTKGGHPWIASYVEFEAERIYLKGYKEGWFIIAKTAPRGNPESLAGMHRDWYLIIGDEASGIPDANFSVLTGALTHESNRMLLLSQPTRSSGFFYNTHNKLSMYNGGLWNAIRADSRDSPLVSSAFIEEKKAEYTDEEFTIKVCGEFPETRSDFLLGRKQSEACIGREVIKRDEAFGILLSCDVGAGEYRDKSVALVAHVTGYGDFGPDARRVQIVSIPICSNTKKVQDFTGNVFVLAGELENTTVLVDAGGMGVVVCQMLETQGLPDVKRVKWGSPCFKQRNRDRFFNLRAQAVVTAARAAKEGRLGICRGAHERELLDQMSRTPYHFDEKARYVIERKDVMKAGGIPSPDIWDAIAFCFLEDVTYNVYESLNRTEDSQVARVLAQVEELFRDV